MTREEAAKLLTIDEAAKFAKVSRRTIYYWMAQGKLIVFTTPSGGKRVHIDSLFTVNLTGTPPDPAKES